MILIDGKQTARDIRAELKAQVEAAVSAGRRAPGLAVILVGEDPASQVYVRNKERACAEAGILSFPYRLPADTTQSAFLSRTSSMAFTREESFFLRMAKVGCSSQDIISGA